MAKSSRSLVILTGITLLLSPTLAQAQPHVLGTDAAACAPGAPGDAVLVTVSGLKDRKGRLRLQYYSDKPEEYLASGAYLRRQEMPVTPAGEMTICITVPQPGRYVMVALHDRDSDGNLSIWSDGIGFSNNPKLALAKPKPEKTLFAAKSGLTTMRIVMNYRRGLSVRPLDTK